MKKEKDMEVYRGIPEGWYATSATTAPVGYVVICNGESLFSGKRKIALIKEDKATT